MRRFIWTADRRGALPMRARVLVVAVVTVCWSAATFALPQPVHRTEDDAAVGDWIEEHVREYVTLYEHLHAHPELSFEENDTAARVAEHLTASGYAVTAGVGGTGVVGLLENGGGPTILVRGDMDALAVTERTGLPYASAVTVTRDDGQRAGVMHACGHDVHVANLLAVATLLEDLRSRWRGTLVIVAQPAEEVGLGAKRMIDDGLFDRFPRPDATLALHVAADLPAGSIGYTQGWAAANVDSVDVTVFGRSGHGARPHVGVDPVVTSAYLVTQLQTLVSRRVDPIKPAVVTVGSIHGGTQRNVIPDEVRLQLTVRSYEDGVRRTLLDGIRQISADVCRTFECPRPPEIWVKEDYTPALYNDPELTMAASALFRAIFGDDRVLAREPEMGGEDFGRYARFLKVPGLLFRLGAVDAATYRASLEPGAPALPSLHSSTFAPAPEPTLRTGIRALANLSLALLRKADGGSESAE